MEETDKSARPPRRSSPPRRSTAGAADGPFLCDEDGAEGRSVGEQHIRVQSILHSAIFITIPVCTDMVFVGEEVSL